MRLNKATVARVRKLVERGERFYAIPENDREFCWGGTRPSGERWVPPPSIHEPDIKAIRYLLDKLEAKG